MIDFKELLELGVFGLCGILVFVIWKIVAYKFPTVNGGGHAKRAADQLEVMNRLLRQLVEGQAQANKILEKMNIAAKLEERMREQKQDENIQRIADKLDASEQSA